MIRCLSLLLLGGLVVQAQDKQAHSAGKAQIHVDGLFAGMLQTWEGGDVRADVVVEKVSGADRIPKKHIGGPRYTPIVVSVSVPPEAPLLAWISEFLTGKTLRKTVVVTTLSLDSAPVSALRGQNCLLTEVAFPAAEAAAKETGRLKLTFAPEVVGAAPPFPAPAAAKDHSKMWSPSNFKLQIDGLDATKTSAIESIKIGSKVVESAIGDARDYQKETSPLEVSNVIVTLSESGSATWRTWLEDFVVKGNNGEAHEKSGTLEFLTANRLETLMTLKFKNLGIMSLTRPTAEAGADTILKAKAELYCERIEIGSPPATTDAVAVPLATPAVPLAEPTDLGARDPADFPRPKGLLRKSYVSSRQKLGMTESAAYSSTQPIEKLEAIYEELCKAAEWEPANRIETGDKAKGGLILVTVWKKATRSAQVTLMPSKEGGTDVTVSISGR